MLNFLFDYAFLFVADNFQIVNFQPQHNAVNTWKNSLLLASCSGWISTKIFH